MPKLTIEEVQVYPWKYTTVQYLAALNVHDPHIGEVSEVQITRMSRSGKTAYMNKQTELWNASAACEEDWRQRVWACFEAGDFTLDDVLLSSEARSAVILEQAERIKAAKDARFCDAMQCNFVQDPQIGQRIYDVGGGGYGTVTKVNRYSVRYEPEHPPSHWDTARTFKADIGQLRYLSYNDLKAVIENPPRIWVFCNGPIELGGSENYYMVAVANDGTVLADHLCSDPAYARHDLNTPPRRDAFARYYRFGYELVFLGRDEGLPTEVHDRFVAYCEQACAS
jgi:hypothetical protein